MAARMYGLFKRAEDGKHWKQVEGTGVYPKATAVRVFQNALLASSFGSGPTVALRPIAGVKASRTPEGHKLCVPCSKGLHPDCTQVECNCGCAMFRRG